MLKAPKRFGPAVCSQKLQIIKSHRPRGPPCRRSPRRRFGPWPEKGDSRLNYYSFYVRFFWIVIAIVANSAHAHTGACLPYLYYEYLTNCEANIFEILNIYNSLHSSVVTDKNGRNFVINNHFLQFTPNIYKNDRMKDDGDPFNSAYKNKSSRLKRYILAVIF